MGRKRLRIESTSDSESDSDDQRKKKPRKLKKKATKHDCRRRYDRSRHDRRRSDSPLDSYSDSSSSSYERNRHDRRRPESPLDSYSDNSSSSSNSVGRAYTTQKIIERSTTKFKVKRSSDKKGRTVPESIPQTKLENSVMLLGDSGVGKTCILTRFRDGQFLSGNYISTVGIDFRNKLVTVDDSQVKLQIWDTAGQERFRSVTHAYYRDAHALLLLYDVTNKQSFDNIRAWLGEIREYAQDDVVIMLLGNKCDCGSERTVRKEDGQRLANEYKVPFMETSAKTGLNVELAFHAVARELKARANKTEEGNADDARFNVQDYLRQQQSQRTSCLNTSCLTT